MFILLLVAAGSLQRWAWRRLAAREVRGDLTRRAARLRFGVAALAPAVLLAGAFAGVLALEGAFSLALISEATVRAFLPALAALTVIGALGWAAFALRPPR